MVFSKQSLKSLAYTRVFQSWMGPPLNSLQNLTHKRTNDIIEKSKIRRIGLQKFTPKKRKCVYFTGFLVSNVTDNAYLHKLWKTWLSAAYFRSYIKLRVILGQSATEILSELQSASPSSVPSKATVSQWLKHSHFSLGNQSFSTVRGKVKNNKKCNEELVARVKAMMNEDARISFGEVASALNIFIGECIQHTG